MMAGLFTLKNSACGRMEVFRSWYDASMWRRSPPCGRRQKPLLRELRTLLGITALTGLRLINRYDVEGLDSAAFDRAVRTVFSEPQVDDATASLPAGDFTAFAVEYLPGQFDQRADSAQACIQLMTQGERPVSAPPKYICCPGSSLPPT